MWVAYRPWTIHTFKTNKTKCLFFKRGNRHSPTLNISINGDKIKQYSVVEYLGCLPNENIYEESITKKKMKESIEKQSFLIAKVHT